MTRSIDHTHDPKAKSWVASANLPDAEFPIQNLPFGVFRHQGAPGPYRCGVAIGDQIFDLKALTDAGLQLAKGASLASLSGSSLNEFMSLGEEAWRQTRHVLFDLLREDNPAMKSADLAVLNGCLVPQASVQYALPTAVGDYTDFYTSIHHALNIGRIFGLGDSFLPPNFKTLPIAYHGRCSTIVISGTDVRRPMGQALPKGGKSPVYGPCLQLDFELELGVFIGTGNERGTQILIDDADSHILGLCLLNDWSARDIQIWESQPLGPFLAKNFSTTISPWIVTLDALEPYRVKSEVRNAADGDPLAYLTSPRNRVQGALDVTVQALLQTEKMRLANSDAEQLSRTNFRHQYWNIAQMVSHHTVGGCELRSGDILGSGTISGPDADEAGALIELSRAGQTPVKLENGEFRSFLEDGDTVELRGWCEREGFVRIGFGRNCGRVMPAIG